MRRAAPPALVLALTLANLTACEGTSPRPMSAPDDPAASGEPPAPVGSQVDDAPGDPEARPATAGFADEAAFKAHVARWAPGAEPAEGPAPQVSQTTHIDPAHAPGATVVTVDDHLVVLRYNHLYSVDVAGPDGPTLVDHRSPDVDALGGVAAFDELVAVGQTVFVIGHEGAKGPFYEETPPYGWSAWHRSVEVIQAFTVDDGGQLVHQGATRFEAALDGTSRTRASWTDGGALWIWRDYALEWGEDDAGEPRLVRPRWLSLDGDGALAVDRPMLPAPAIRAAEEPPLEPALQVLVRCDVPAEGPVDCQAAGLLGEAQGALHVAAGAAHWWQYGRLYRAQLGADGWGSRPLPGLLDHARGLRVTASGDVHAMVRDDEPSYPPQGPAGLPPLPEGALLDCALPDADFGAVEVEPECVAVQPDAPGVVALHATVDGWALAVRAPVQLNPAALVPQTLLAVRLEDGRVFERPLPFEVQQLTAVPGGGAVLSGTVRVGRDRHELQLAGVALAAAGPSVTPALALPLPSPAPVTIQASSALPGRLSAAIKAGAPGYPRWVSPDAWWGPGPINVVVFDAAPGATPTLQGAVGGPLQTPAEAGCPAEEVYDHFGEQPEDARDCIDAYRGAQLVAGATQPVAILGNVVQAVQLEPAVVSVGEPAVLVAE